MSVLRDRILVSFRAQGLMKTLGAELVLVEDGEVHIALAGSPHISQQHGYAHAGAISSILDSACGYAALTRASDGYEVVTAEFKITAPPARRLACEAAVLIIRFPGQAPCRLRALSSIAWH